MSKRDPTPEEIAERERQRRRTGWIRAISVRVYCMRLEESNSPAGAVKRMLAKDADDGSKIATRAEAYIPTVRATIEALGLPDVYLIEAADMEPW